MSPGKMTLEQISKVAEDVRTIEKFQKKVQDESLNHGFDAGLISVSVTPSDTSRSIDWPFISFSFFLIILTGLIAVRFFAEITEKVEELLLVCSLMVGTLAIWAAHLKFKDKTGIVILSIGLIVVVSIGFGVVTPEEAITEAKALVN